MRVSVRVYVRKRMRMLSCVCVRVRGCIPVGLRASCVRASVCARTHVRACDSACLYLRVRLDVYWRAALMCIRVVSARACELFRFFFITSI